MAASSSKAILVLTTLALWLPGTANTAITLKERQKASQPDAQHQLLAPLIGEWKAVIKIRVRPDTNPEIYTGNARHEWAMGKRFVKQTLQGKFLAKNYIGFGLIGFDKTLHRYVGIWTSNLNTGIARFEGDIDGAGKVISFDLGVNIENGNKVESRAILTLESGQRIRFQRLSRFPGEGGDFVKMLEIIYKKKKPK